MLVFIKIAHNKKHISVGQFNNAAMVGYIVVELIRLATLSILMVTWLLVLKQNSMDIGLVIGASVAGGFVLCKYLLSTSRNY